MATQNRLAAASSDSRGAHRTKRSQQRLKLGLGRDPRNLVFAREDGEPIDPDSLTNGFGRLIADNEVTPIPFHGLRLTQ